MNNELIERIDQEIQNLMGQRDVIERLLPNNTAVRELTQIIKVLMDCKAALSQREAHPVASSQDVEEFIANRQRYNSTINHYAIHTDDLRAWMAGHVRAKDIAAKEWNQQEGRDGKLYTDGWNACREAMLTASKEQK